MKKHWITILVFLSFISVNVIYYRNVPGDDLSSSYIACRVLAEGEKSHLYSYDPEYFHVIRDPVWTEIAQKTSFRGFLHPYVQTPLWAYVLMPLCTTMKFHAFNLIFLVLNFASIAGTIWLAAYQWAPSFLAKPLWLAGFFTIFSLMTPTYYMAFLNQTHPLFLFTTILSVFLASRKKDMLSGFLLAIAAAIKLTPAIVAVHWLISKHRKSAVSFLIWSVVLGVLTFASFGEKTILEYLTNLKRISNVLLVSYNNQSLAAWLYGSSFELSEILDWRIHPLPSIVKIIGFCLTGLVVLYLIIAYQRKPGNLASLEAISVTSLLVTATIFTPITWNHYYIILAIPLLIMLNHGLETRKPWLIVTSGLIVLLNVWPIAPHPLIFPLHSLTVIRSHFYSGIICLFALLVIGGSTSKGFELKSDKEK